MKCYSFSHLEDCVLDRDFDSSIHQLCSTSAVMLAYLAEFDARRRFLPAGYASMFSFCVAKGFTDDMAAKSIQAARVARQFPDIFAGLAERRLSLTAVVLLAPHLFPETAEELLTAAANKSCSEIRQLLAKRRQRPESPTPLQPITLPGADEQHASKHVDEHETQHATQHVAPPAHLVSPVRRVELPESLEEQITYARALMPQAGSVVEVLERAMKSLIAELEKQKFGAGTRTRPRRSSTNPRYVPPEVRKAVFLRDQGQCAFVSGTGQRCEARERLEFDHIDPVARGGEATVDGMRLLCRAHNQYAAEQAFGPAFMRNKRQQAKSRTQAKRPLELHPDVAAALRTLGYRPQELRAAQSLCQAISHESVEHQVRHVLQCFAPKCRRDPAPHVSIPTDSSRHATALASPLAPGV